MSSKSIIKRPNGKYRARYRDVAGKEHARHFERKTDAQRWLDEVTTSVVSGQYVDPRAGRITFGEWFEQWSSRQGWEPDTARTAVTVARSLTFADVPLSSLRSSHIQVWVKSMTQPGPRRSGGLAPSTMKLRFNYVRMALIAAVAEPVIAQDPSRHVKLPTRARRAQIAVDAEEVPSPDTVRRALDAAPAAFRPFVAVCAFAGLRLGEAAGLRVQDVSTRARTIRVQQQVQGTNRGETHFTEPKYGSVRTIHVPEALVTMLTEHAAQHGRADADLLFRDDLGHSFNRNSAGHQWRSLRAAIGIDRSVTLHDLRHFFASGLIAAGCDVVTVQRALGHSTPSITLNVYTHLWPQADDRTRAAATELMVAVIGPDAPNDDNNEAMR